ncbi:MAG: wax ester/triacylglycerol synthase family O-acyltransferase [Propionivibrio sp.]|jgi:WS/DGAT/MGAT family acyltransferase|nr:wax ester/triacylglycerol synthase family O-acyltransferase [Propionivibrio sp.]MBP6709859.1 wax ester/triacylglycerol synthase family O-acyltransferase [Propionivibrio sp.]
MSSRERVRERMASIDTAWLRMDRPANLMQIIGVMVFDGRLDPERFKRTIAKRLLRYHRFRQIAELDSDGAWWVDDDDFDLDSHVRRTVLPAPGGKRELQKFVAEMASEPLNPARPRWEYQLVETADGDSAVVVRVHHAIADGIALIGVLHSLTDDAPDAPETGGREAGPPKRPSRKAEGEDKDADDGDLFWSIIAEPITDLALASIRLGGTLWGHYQGLRNDPGTLLDYASVAGAIANEVGKLALMPSDSHTRLKGKPGTVKRVAWSDPIPLPEVKAIGKVLGCSVNDLLLSSVAGALRGYLQDKGDSTTDVDLRAMVPVNLRSADRKGDLGNHFGLVALELPVGIENPLARLYTTKARMEALKSSYQAQVTYGLLGLVGMAPKFLQQQVLDLVASKATAVMTNVPGPQLPRYLAGVKLKQQMFWVPQTSNIGIGVSILSYDGKVQFGLITDKGLVDDPERIVDRFSAEFEKLLLLVLMEPWSRLRDPDAVESALDE